MIFGSRVPGHHPNTHGPRKCFQARVERAGRKPLIATFGGLPLKRQRNAVITDHEPARPTHRKELITRLRAERCEMCKRTGEVQVHHVGKLAPRQTGAATTSMGGTHGQKATQDSRSLRNLPRHHPCLHRDNHAVNHRRAGRSEMITSGSGGGRWEKDQLDWHLAQRPTSPT